MNESTKTKNDNMRQKTHTFIGLKWHARFCLSRILRSKNQALLLVLCVSLSVVTLVALSGFAESANRSILKDARKLHASDIVVRSNYPFEKSFLEAIEDLDSQNVADSARVYSFYSVVRSPGEENSLLVEIKAPEKGYPFYGEVRLGSGRKFSEVLASGTALAEQAALDRLGLSVGDDLLVGNETLKVVDVVVSEPDRPVNVFSLGPRLFVSFEDLESLGLVTKASRVGYRVLLKVQDPDELNAVLQFVKSKAGDHIRVDSFRTARSRVKRFFNNFIFFLNLTGIFTLLLAGIGIRSTVEALLAEERDSMTILKTLGAKSRFVILNYTMVVFVLGAAGALLGLAGGLGLQQLLPRLFGELLPQSMRITASVQGVVRGLSMGLLAAGLFAFLPLFRLRGLKPTAIFRKEQPAQKKDFAFYFTAFFIVCLFSALVLWQLNEIESGVYFVSGFIGFLAVATVLTQLTFKGLKKAKVRSLVLRQALRGLYRPGNATIATVVTLAASLSLLFSLMIVEGNIDASFVKSFPEDSPNLFFINILPEQRERFPEVLQMDVEYFPIVRARLKSVAGNPVDVQKERDRRGDNLARSFNLTYRHTLLDDEKVLEGDGLFGAKGDVAPVSVLDSVAEIADMKIGDLLVFDIQGVPLTARISSIRTRTREAMNPFFYFVFPESVLKPAPHTFFTAAKVPERQIGKLQNRVVAKFPNVSAINLTQTIRVFSALGKKLSGIVRFFSSFSILAGLLIIVSAIFATRYARMSEAVYFKVLGAKKAFVLKIFALENMMIGLISATLGAILAQAASFSITWFVLDIDDYRPCVLACFSMVLGFAFVTAAIGSAMSMDILKLKPAGFLREREEYA